MSIFVKPALLAVLLLFSVASIAEQYDIYLSKLDCKVSNGVEIKTTGVNSFGTTAFVDTTWGSFKREAFASVIHLFRGDRPWNASVQLLMKGSGIETYFLFLKLDANNPNEQVATGTLVRDVTGAGKLGDAQCNIVVYDSGDF